jgi:selenium donor protein
MTTAGFRLTGCARTGGCAAKVGQAELERLIGGLAGAEGGDARVLVGPQTADDAGVFQLGGRALVATTDFIPPVCDDPHRYGRVAAANAMSDVYAMGGVPLFALNLCCFPGSGIPDGVLAAILAGAAGALAEAGAALLGGHTVRDAELKFGLAVVGEADPGRILTNAGARAGDLLVLTKPLGCGVMINAFKVGALDEPGLEPALREMERLNAVASRLALAQGATAAVDVTGFGLAGHALGMARASRAGIRIHFNRLPVHDGFYLLVEAGVTTGCTAANDRHAGAHVADLVGLSSAQRELLFDPQTSGGLLLALPPAGVAPLLDALAATGHRAAEIGEVVDGPPRFEVV